MEILINTIKNFDPKVKKIMKIGLYFSLSVSIIATFILLYYIFFYTSNEIYYIGLQVMQLSISFAVYFFASALAIDKIQKDLLWAKREQSIKKMLSFCFMLRMISSNLYSLFSFLFIFYNLICFIFFNYFQTWNWNLISYSFFTSSIFKSLFIFSWLNSTYRFNLWSHF